MSVKLNLSKKENFIKKTLFLVILAITLITGTIWGQILDGKDLGVSSQNVKIGEIITLRFYPYNSSFRLLSIYENNDNPLFEKISDTQFKAIAPGKTFFSYNSHGEICEENENGRTCTYTYAKGNSPVINVTESAYSQPLCGDVNNSGKVDIIDALLVTQYYVGSIQTFVAPRGADVNNDGVINIVDALMIAQFYVGANIILDCGYDKDEIIRISHIGGIQCEITYFQNIDEAINNLRSAGINVLSMKVDSMAVIALCGVGNGITYIAEINRADLEKALKLGWSHNPSS